MPMSVDYYEPNLWGDFENEPRPLDNSAALGFVDSISAAIAKGQQSDASTRGLMRFFDGDRQVQEKVLSLVFRAEARAGRLWGVADCRVIGALTADELETLKAYVSGQASDGFGEWLEQQGIKVGERELYVHLWSHSSSWSIRTEQECFAPDHGHTRLKRVPLRNSRISHAAE